MSVFKVSHCTQRIKGVRTRAVFAIRKTTWRMLTDTTYLAHLHLAGSCSDHSQRGVIPSRAIHLALRMPVTFPPATMPYTICVYARAFLPTKVNFIITHTQSRWRASRPRAFQLQQRLHISSSFSRGVTFILWSSANDVEMGGTWKTAPWNRSLHA